MNSFRVFERSSSLLKQLNIPISEVQLMEYCNSLEILTKYYLYRTYTYHSTNTMYQRYGNMMQPTVEVNNTVLHASEMKSKRRHVKLVSYQSHQFIIIV